MKILEKRGKYRLTYSDGQYVIDEGTKKSVDKNGKTVTRAVNQRYYSSLVPAVFRFTELAGLDRSQDLKDPMRAIVKGQDEIMKALSVES